MKSTSNGKAASDDRSGLFFWPDEILTDSLNLTDFLAESIKAEARKDINPWKNIYYHGYLTLWSVKWYLKRRMRDKRWMQMNVPSKSLTGRTAIILKPGLPPP